KGENLVVTVLDDPGLFLDTVQPAPGVVCTSPIQTYLDLSVAGWALSCSAITSVVMFRPPSLRS
ncbi:hypothetical protein DAI43_18800, partial [Achromobacter xylosoxidans]